MVYAIGSGVKIFPVVLAVNFLLRSKAIGAVKAIDVGVRPWGITAYGMKVQKHVPRWKIFPRILICVAVDLQRKRHAMHGVVCVCGPTIPPPVF
jgi:hypothetical protein